jgi:hypothetical protein
LVPVLLYRITLLASNSCLRGRQTRSRSTFQCHLFYIPKPLCHDRHRFGYSRCRWPHVQLAEKSYNQSETTVMGAASMTPPMEPSSPHDGGIRKRVCKACDRCRLKKSKVGYLNVDRGSKDLIDLFPVRWFQPMQSLQSRQRNLCLW